MAERPLLVVSDLHLGRGVDTTVTRALVELLAAHPDHELVLNGDVFDLSIEPAGFRPASVLAELLAPKVELRAALRAHLLRGAPVSFLAGNHDASLASPAARPAIGAALGVSDAAPLTCAPWFIRRGRVHVEHGNLYDADNAPNHPLVAPSWQTEPLGIAITRRFLVPHRALEFFHRHETTPVAGLRRVFTLYGPRAPQVVVGYFAYAARQCRSTWHRELIRSECELGNERLAGYARSQGLAPETLLALLRETPRPTHHYLRRTFTRLYLDRVAASMGSVGGAAALAVGVSMPGLLLAGAGTTYLGASLARARNRYRGVVQHTLRVAAGRIVALTGAEMVIMGHTHDEDENEHYVNTGSFAFPNEPGRPYARVDEQGRVERRRWNLLHDHAPRAA